MGEAKGLASGPHTPAASACGGTMRMRESECAEGIRRSGEPQPTMPGDGCGYDTGGGGTSVRGRVAAAACSCWCAGVEVEAAVAGAGTTPAPLPAPHVSSAPPLRTPPAAIPSTPPPTHPSTAVASGMPPVLARRWRGAPRAPPSPRSPHPCGGSEMPRELPLSPSPPAPPAEAIPSASGRGTMTPPRKACTLMAGWGWAPTSTLPDQPRPLTAPPTSPSTSSGGALARLARDREAPMSRLALRWPRAEARRRGGSGGGARAPRTAWLTGSITPPVPATKAGPAPAPPTGRSRVPGPRATTVSSPPSSSAPAAAAAAAPGAAPREAPETMTLAEPPPSPADADADGAATSSTELRRRAGFRTTIRPGTVVCGSSRSTHAASSSPPAPAPAASRLACRAFAPRVVSRSISARTCRPRSLATCR